MLLSKNSLKATALFAKGFYREDKFIFCEGSYNNKS